MCWSRPGSTVPVCFNLTVTSFHTQPIQANRRSTLVFCVNIEHVKALTQTFRKHGVDARYLFSETPPAQRYELVNDFKQHRFPVLVNCGTLVANLGCRKHSERGISCLDRRS